MNNTQPTVRSGEKIPLFDGSNDDLLFNREHLNKLIMVCNAILACNNWIVTDHGVLFKPGSGTGAGGVNPRGEWSASSSRPGGQYKKLDLVVIRAGSNAGTYYALQDVPDSGAGIAPTLPDTGNQYWLCISNSPSMGQWM